MMKICMFIDQIGMFQSPRTGKFESNPDGKDQVIKVYDRKFQSPRTGKFESNLVFRFQI